VFVILGNISGNAVAFGIYCAIAAGKDPLNSDENNHCKGLVVGLAIMTLTICATIHIFSRRGGVLLNNIFAVIKISMVLVLAILGFVHAGGKYLQAFEIGQTATSNGTTPDHRANATEINNAPKTNFDHPFATQRHDLASYVNSFLFAMFSYTGFEQPFYVLSEVKKPRKVFPRYVLLGMITATLLYVLINVSYFFVVPKEVYTADPENSLNMAGAFLHYLFDNSYGEDTAGRVMAGLIAVSIFGNVIVMTFTAARVKQEIAKEGILPYSLFFATGHTTPLAWLKSRFTRPPYPRRSHIGTTVNLENHLEKSPIAALTLHWATSVFLVLVTIPFEPADQYSFLTVLYSYVNLNVVGCLVSAGLLYLKIDSFIHKSAGRDWNNRVSYMPWISPIHAVIYFCATAFFLCASYVPPASGSTFGVDIQGYAWYIVPTIGISSILWGVVWWFGLKGLEWQRRRQLVVTRTPYIERDEDGGYVQKAELVEHDWITNTKNDYESGHS
jgi:amino acid transporter